MSDVTVGKTKNYLLSPPVEHMIPHENPKHKPLESHNFLKKPKQLKILTILCILWDWLQMKTQVIKIRYKEVSKKERFSHPANHHTPSIPVDYGIYLVKYSQVKTPCV